MISKMYNIRFGPDSGQILAQAKPYLAALDRSTDLPAR